MELFRKGVSAIMLFLLLVSTLNLAFNIQPVKAESGTIIVPDDYPTIQEAINAANPGDTIIVKSGTYTENVKVNKDHLNIRSENGMEATIVQAENSSDHVFEVTAEFANISGFSVKGASGKSSQYIMGVYLGSAGIYLKKVGYCNILDNNISNNTDGIFFESSDNNNILNNKIISNKHGIWWLSSHGNNVSRNTIANCAYAVYSAFTYGDVISENIVTNGGQGISLQDISDSKVLKNTVTSNGGMGISLSSRANNNVVFGNNITDHGNNTGLSLSEASGNVVFENSVKNNYWGVYTALSNNNIIYHNTFAENVKQVYDNELYPPSINVWDDGYPSGGNYWSDYTDVDLNNDGIWDNPYVIDANNQDNYPLVNPWTPTPSIQEWLFDGDFQYNLDDDYGTVEGTGHLSGTATLSAGTLSIGGQITINGPLPSGVPEVYLVATDGQDKELAKQAVDLSRFSYWPTGTNTYVFSGQIPNVIQPINNGHYEVSALITYDAAKYEFFVDTASYINSHYLPLLIQHLNYPPIPIVIHYPSSSSNWFEGLERLYRERYHLFQWLLGSTLYYDAGEDITFDASWSFDLDGEIVSYKWDFGDGSISTEKKVSHSYSEKGIYRVTLTIEDDRNEVRERVFDLFISIPTKESIEKLKQDVNFLSERSINHLSGEVLDGIKEVAQAADDFKESVGLTALDAFLDVIFEVIPLKDIYGDTLIQKMVLQIAEKTGESIPKEITKEVVKAILKKGWELGIYSYDDFLINDAETKVQNMIENEKNAIITLKNDLLNAIDGLDLTRNDVDLYRKDLKARMLGNMFLSQFFRSQADLLYNFDEIKKQDENSWTLRVGEKLYTGSVLLLSLPSIFGPLVTIPPFITDLIEDFKSMKTDEGMYTLCHLLLESNVFNPSQEYSENVVKGIYQNTIKGLQLILDKGQPHVAEGRINSIVNDGTIYRIEIENTGEYTAGFKLITTFYKTYRSYELSPLIGRYYDLPTSVSNALGKDWIELGPREKRVIDIEIPGESPFVYLYLLGESDTGLYGLDYKMKTIERPWLSQIASWFSARMKSPGELRVYDSSGRVTGLINGEVKEEIPNSVYDGENNMVVVFSSSIYPSELSFYHSEVVGTSEGNYGLEITSVNDAEATTFTAENIPILPNTVNQYTINWTALSLGEEGVTVQVDSNGDGVFEHIFTSDTELTQREYVIATDDVSPQTWHNIREPKFVVNGVTCLTSATPLELIAEDNLGGSGVASTAYRIYNASYDSDWITYTEPFYLTGLSDGTYQIDYNSTDYAGNVELTNTVTVFLDNTPPTTSLTIGEPKYISDTTYVTSDTPFTLEANDNAGSGVYSIAYRIYNGAYDSGWQPYTEPFYLTSLTDGVYTIEFNSTDNVGNVEVTNSVQVALFSWDYVFTDSYGRGTTLKINTVHKFFQFITPDNDYGIRRAVYMRLCGRAIIIRYYGYELHLITVAVDTKLDFCAAIAWDVETGKRYFLIDKVGIEN